MNAYQRGSILIEGRNVPTGEGVTVRPMTLDDCIEWRKDLVDVSDAEELLDILIAEVCRLSASRDAWGLVAPALSHGAGLCPECGVQWPDEDGLCRACGGSCMGSAVDDMRERIENANALDAKWSAR
jgi:hypothetical protein